METTKDHPKIAEMSLRALWVNEWYLGQFPLQNIALDLSSVQLRVESGADHRHNVIHTLHMRWERTAQKISKKKEKKIGLKLHENANPFTVTEDTFQIH